MFFVLSKLLIFFISPTFWIVTFLTVGWITKRRRLKKFFYTIALIIFIVFSNPFLLNQVARWWDAPEVTLPADRHYSCAIVLGGYASEDYHGHGYFNGTADRFIQAIKLKAQGKVSNILISGGSSRLISTEFRESDWVAQNLREFNIPESNIIIENDSRNSFENALFSKKLLDSADLLPPYILVTSAYHMRRALFTFKKMGVDVIPYPSNYIAGRSETGLSDFFPSLGTLEGWSFYLKEMIGYVVYIFKNN